MPAFEPKIIFIYDKDGKFVKQITSTHPTTNCGRGIAS